MLAENTNRGLKPLSDGIGNLRSLFEDALDAFAAGIGSRPPNAKHLLNLAVGGNERSGGFPSPVNWSCLQ